MSNNQLQFDIKELKVVELLSPRDFSSEKFIEEYNLILERDFKDKGIAVMMSPDTFDMFPEDAKKFFMTLHNLVIALESLETGFILIMGIPLHLFKEQYLSRRKTMKQVLVDLEKGVRKIENEDN